MARTSLSQQKQPELSQTMLSSSVAHNEYKSRRQTRDAQLEQSLWVSVWHISAATATNRLVELITETVKGGEVVGNV